ncbi:hypothetical protein EVAR_58864_1 [Eumeta japonica]|uniref:Uncharacterized protein n=1 Tax=Eumeta variegata TaxID=151549 RepID=A0A4C1YB75_EUMVA|nr:hypothetical protein EVAR_58864_1 [Eumeta japonica]
MPFNSSIEYHRMRTRRGSILKPVPSKRAPYRRRCEVTQLDTEFLKPLFKTDFADNFDRGHTLNVSPGSRVGSSPLPLSIPMPLSIPVLVLPWAKNRGRLYQSDRLRVEAVHSPDILDLSTVTKLTVDSGTSGSDACPATPAASPARSIGHYISTRWSRSALGDRTLVSSYNIAKRTHARSGHDRLQVYIAGRLSSWSLLKEELDDGRLSLLDEICESRPSTTITEENATTVRQLIEENRRIIYEEIRGHLEINQIIRTDPAAHCRRSSRGLKLHVTPGRGAEQRLGSFQVLISISEFTCVYTLLDKQRVFSI